MRKLISIAVFLFAGVSGFAQAGFDRFLQEIVRNNTQLKAFQSAAEAQKLENRTGLAPADPSVEGGYLWGSPAGIGNRRDFSATQEIEFPTVYVHQQKLATIRERQADLEYLQHRREILQQAADLWVEWGYLNKRTEVLVIRQHDARELARAYDEMLATGEANRIDRNKAALYLLQTEKQLQQLELDMQQTAMQLASLNGGKPVAVDESDYQPVQLPGDREAWLEQVMDVNPQLQWLQQELQAGKQSEKLNRAKSLPRLNGGYMMESVGAEKFQGITVGLSVPLWERKNTVKAARAQQEAALLQENDFRLQWRNHLLQIFHRAENAQRLVDSYRGQLAQIQQKELLDEALHAGQISLIDYLLELQFNYEAVDQLMEAEKQLQATYAELLILTR